MESQSFTERLPKLGQGANMDDDHTPFTYNDVDLGLVMYKSSNRSLQQPEVSYHQVSYVERSADHRCTFIARMARWEY